MASFLKIILSSTYLQQHQSLDGERNEDKEVVGRGRGG